MGIQQVKMCYICREEERYDGVWHGCLPAQRVDLTTCSSYAGEIQLDTSMSMHSYRSRCATVFLLASSCRPETYTQRAARILFAPLDTKLPREPSARGESLEMPAVWHGLRDRERQPPSTEAIEQAEQDLDEYGEVYHADRDGNDYLHVWYRCVFLF